MRSSEDDENQVPAKKVGYVWSEKYEEVCDFLPSNMGRSSRIHSLIRAYELDKLMTIIEPAPASVDELCTFHDSEYIDFLLNIPSHNIRPKKRKRSSSSSSTSSTSSIEDPNKTFGLEYDCPSFDSLPEYICLLGGAAIQSASLLSPPQNYDVVINWEGGRHHALRSSAAGYCYLADIPLSILTLLPNFKSILYIDLDAHHGDGVEFAFKHTEKVITLSFHVWEPGFFPGTGKGVKESGRGVYNVALERGMKGPVWEEIVKRCVEIIWKEYDPDCLVVQCGCDGLLTDPHRALQLTTYSFQRVVSFILALKKPVLLLGGGGYHPPSTAKHFTLLTALVLGKILDEDIPLEAEYWEELEKDGGIHVGRDSELTTEGEIEVERLCEILHKKLKNR